MLYLTTTSKWHCKVDNMCHVNLKIMICKVMVKITCLHGLINSTKSNSVRRFQNFVKSSLMLSNCCSDVFNYCAMIDLVCSCMCYNLNQSIWKKLYTQNFNFVLYVNFGRKKLFNARLQKIWSKLLVKV